MRKLLSISILALFLGVSSFGNDIVKGDNPETATLSGKVTDKKSGESLAGVALTIEGIDKTVYSDLDGNFVVEGLTSGLYNLTVHYISYQEKNETVTVNVTTDNTISFCLESLNK